MENGEQNSTYLLSWQNSGGSRTIDWKVEGVGDFDGDGYDDVFWRNSVTRRQEIWWSGLTVRPPLTAPQLGNLGSDWTYAGIGDVNGDGYADLVTRGTPGWPTQSVVMVTLMGPNGPVSTRQWSGVGPEWVIIALGRMDSGTTRDIVFRNSNTGAVVVWYMNGLSDPSSATVGFQDLSWSPRGARDFDGNARSDLLWYQASTDKLSVWLFSYSSFDSYEIGTVGMNSQLAGFLTK
ncbi:MAG: FG-GAP repeat protein [Deltaproteobacteria bacterium]|nr:FG-GAP repeat protein [Deltaproteobacteria bacterium]